MFNIFTSFSNLQNQYIFCYVHTRSVYLTYTQSGLWSNKSNKNLSSENILSQCPLNHHDHCRKNSYKL